MKPLRMNRRTGVWSNLTKVEGGGKLNRHYHVGPVTGFVLEGSWYYVGRDWVARKGMVIWEPPGDVHTLMTGDEGTITHFTLEGALIYVDDDDNVAGFDDCLSFTEDLRGPLRGDRHRAGGPGLLTTRPPARSAAQRDADVAAGGRDRPPGAGWPARRRSSPSRWRR